MPKAFSFEIGKKDKKYNAKQVTLSNVYNALRDAAQAANLELDTLTIESNGNP